MVDPTVARLCLRTTTTRLDVARLAATWQPSISLTDTRRTDDHEENDATRRTRFYADPDNQTPQGPARRRNSKLSELVPVRFPPETLAKVRDAADADDRSVSAWIRRAVDRELEQTSKTA